MKLLKKLLLTIGLILLLSVVLLYVLLQTRWGSGWISRWVTSHTGYHLVLDHMEHSWSSPAELRLYGVKWGRANRVETLSAEQVTLGLSTRQLTEPRHFQRLNLQNGTLRLSSQSPSLPVAAEVLQLINMTLTLETNDGEWRLHAQQVNAGATPWLPTPGNPLGKNTRFQFSAGTATLNDIPAKQLLLQGDWQDQQLRLNDFGADVAQGQLTGSAQRDTRGHWTLDNLRLSNVRLQTADSFDEFRQRFAQLPPLTLKHFNLIDARIEGHDWAFNELNLTLQNFSFQQDAWFSTQGSLTFNAGDLLMGDLHLSEPVAELLFSEQGVTLKQFATRWDEGLLNASGSWSRDSKHLQLDELVIADLVYTLPDNWRQWWHQPLPEWLSTLTISRLIANRNLLIDINPQFPFQLTSLNGTAQNLQLAQAHQWGIWSGTLDLQASDATFNKVDMRRLSLRLTADAQQITLSDVSALTGTGMLEASTVLHQPPPYPFSLTLTGRSVPVDLLSHWGWPHNSSLQGNGNLQLQLQGQLAQQIVNGRLHLTGSDGQQVSQQMQAGAVQESGQQ